MSYANTLTLMKTIQLQCNCLDKAVRDRSHLIVSKFRLGFKTLLDDQGVFVG